MNKATIADLQALLSHFRPEDPLVIEYTKSADEDGYEYRKTQPVVRIYLHGNTIAFSTSRE
jgi:hypothetical protein